MSGDHSTHGLSRGHGIYWHKTEKVWKYIDNDQPIGPRDRPCAYCNLNPTPEGHDACLGTMEGVRFACCGHGATNDSAYIAYSDGRKTVRGWRALLQFTLLGIGPLTIIKKLRKGENNV